MVSDPQIIEQQTLQFANFEEGFKGKDDQMRNKKVSKKKKKKSKRKIKSKKEKDGKNKKREVNANKDDDDTISLITDCPEEERVILHHSRKATSLSPVRNIANRRGRLLSTSCQSVDDGNINYPLIDYLSSKDNEKAGRGRKDKIRKGLGSLSPIRKRNLGDGSLTPPSWSKRNATKLVEVPLFDFVGLDDSLRLDDISQSSGEETDYSQFEPSLSLSIASLTLDTPPERNVEIQEGT